MSRIGRQPIPIPTGVEVNLDGPVITVKGPRGTLTRSLPAAMSVETVDATGAGDTLSGVLADMEAAGITIDLDWFASLKARFAAERRACILDIAGFEPEQGDAT